MKLYSVKRSCGHYEVQLFTAKPPKEIDGECMRCEAKKRDMWTNTPTEIAIDDSVR